MVTYKQWETTDRTTLNTYTKSPPDLIEVIVSKTEKLVSHDYIARSQADFLRNLKQSTKETWDDRTSWFRWELFLHGTGRSPRLSLGQRAMHAAPICPILQKQHWWMYQVLKSFLLPASTMVFGGLDQIVQRQMNMMMYKFCSCIHMVLQNHSNGHSEKMCVGFQDITYCAKYLRQ